MSVPFNARVETRAFTEQELDTVEVHLGRMRDQGVEYAVIPAPQDTVRPNAFRVVVHEPGVCAILALDTLAEPREGPASDGLPFPPPEMVRLAAGISTGHRFYQRFIQGGAQVADRFRDLLARNGLDIERCGSLLDFGCGCGRVMRRWQGLTDTRLHGSDYNPRMIEWCRGNLPFAEFSVNALEPGLDHPDGAFELVYSYSVFTHLPEDLQRPWLDELVRVTAPGGHLLLTFHGEHAAQTDLGEEERAPFGDGDLVVVARDAGDYGTNACAVYHPAVWIRGEFTAGLEVLDHWPGDSSFKQDAFLIKKPAGQ